MFLFIVPAITMRVWAEEKKMGTIELLLTMPLRDHEVVLGKFLASFLFLAITLVLSFMIPVVVLWSGPADLGVILASYVGAMLMGAAYISLGVWLSSYTDNQIIAFILALITSFLFFIVGQVFVLQSIPSFLTGFFQFLGIGAHFDSISRGVIDSRDVLFYLTFIGFFLFLNVQQISSRRFK
jgi:ABC-2 type transport system permease protein